MVDMKMNVGIVTLEEIKDSVFSMCNDRKDDELSFLDFTRCIQELHKKTWRKLFANVLVTRMLVCF